VNVGALNKDTARPVSRLVRSLALVFSLFLALVALPSSAQTPARTLDSVLARFARIEGLTLHFREEKAIALLSTPIVTEGTLAYARPGRLARRGGSQAVLIDGGTLRMMDGGHEQHIDLASQPVVRSFVDSFRALLAGDRAALEQSYALTFAAGAEPDAWTITLRPRRAPLDQFLSRIEFRGRGDALLAMVMTEVSGDVTTTTFSDVDDHHRFSASESARVFALP
jgi:outer membrane lipoprotein-sorting protein